MRISDWSSDVCSSDVLNAQAQLANDRSELPQFGQQLAEARNMLAILVGVAPAELGPTEFDLTSFALPAQVPVTLRSAEHTSELQSLMRTSYAVFCLKKKPSPT